MLVIGLTGGIASGKSTVSAILAAKGAPVIDADQLGWRTYEPGASAYDAVVAAFGKDIVAEDGTVNRRALGAKVFGKPEEMKRLTDIVWPAIKDLGRQELDALRAEGKQVAVLEAAVLIEAAWLDLVDEVWVVVVDRGVARERLMARNGLSAEDADARIDSQLTNDERKKYAGVVIENSGSLESLEQAVDREWAALQERIGTKA